MENTLVRRLRDNELQVVDAIRKNAMESGAKAYAVNEELAGCSIGDIITLELENRSLVRKTIFFGTPLSISEEAPSVKSIFDAIPEDNRWDSELNLLIDNNGEGANFLQQINRRFVRRPHAIKGMVVVSNNEDQREISPKMVEVPVNLGDARSKSQEFKGVYTEFNEYDLVAKPTMLGDFCGVSYDLLAQTKVKINIHIIAVDQITIRV